MWALSVFVGPMTNELTQWDRSDIFGAVTVRVLISAAGVPLVGRFMDKRSGAMVLSMIASGVGGAVLIGISRVQNPWEFMLLYGVIGGIAWVGQTNIIAAGGPCLAKGLANRVHTSVVFANSDIASEACFFVEINSIFPPLEIVE